MNTPLTDLLPVPTMQNLHDPSGIGYADTLDPQVPLSVRVGPYVTIAAGDIIDLYCDNQIALNYTVRDEDLTPETPTFVVLPLSQKFIHPAEITLYYEVTEPIGGVKNQSLTITVPVKLTVPGGTDINPATPWENEALAKPVVSPPGIITSAEDVSVEIAPYVNMAIGDDIKLSWHGQFVRMVIMSEAEIGKPVVIQVPKGAIEYAGSSDMIEVRYEIRDVVNNWSRWSLPTYTRVEIGKDMLPAPVAPQAPNMELDLETLAGAPVQILVLSNPQVAKGDEVMLSVERETGSGMPLPTYRTEKIVQNPLGFLDFSIPNELFQPISQGRARVKYRVLKATGQVLLSKNLPLKITGNMMTLDAPRIPVAEQNEGVLDPTAKNVLVEVPPYYFMLPGQDVDLVWMGKTAGGANVMHEERKNLSNSDIGNTLEYAIPDTKVSALAGGSLQVYYTITSFEREFFKSPVLNVLVGDDTGVSFAAPSIDELDDSGLLDPANIALEATVRIARYPGMAENDKVTLYWDGQGSSGSYSDFTVINSGTVSREVVFRVNKRYVEANTNSAVSTWYEVDRGTQKFVSSQLRFRVGSMEYVPLPRPVIKEAVGDTLDPADAPKGATVLIAASANLESGDVVEIRWEGPKGSDTQKTVIGAADAGRELSVVFASQLVHINDGQTVDVSYAVQRAGGLQQSDVVSLQVLSAVLELPAPTMDSVTADGILRPSLIPETGAIVRVNYRNMASDDQVAVFWSGVTTYTPPAQVVGDQPALVFNVPKAHIDAAEGSPAKVSYQVIRNGVTRPSEELSLNVLKGLEFDTSPVTLGGKIYLLPGHPELLPAFPNGTTVKRVAAGGTPPYTYASSMPKVAHVDASGLVSVRSKGGAIITATDALGERKSFTVSVTGVIECHGVGSGNLTQVSNAASRIGARIPSIHELIEIYNAYGNRWPMGNANYWSSTVAKNVFGAKWYYVKNLNTGQDFKLLHINNSLGVAIR